MGPTRKLSIRPFFRLPAPLTCILTLIFSTFLFTRSAQHRLQRHVRTSQTFSFVYLGLFYTTRALPNSLSMTRTFYTSTPSALQHILPIITPRQTPNAIRMIRISSSAVHLPQPEALH
ncbi:hypothetical protein GYMLUDRAFT_553274 [Collybiopsis luxurians FD-317 M1]|uniref:Uncharacterized protein n=1 Tax=Collybiopsis luxurians FD-317 M1 TaxID=944289 RepID=A0A0D0C287_9AGAR|nr:hypothetical protein GYMLUDRAFT_553274 [Collybiopsis luxurians FD-317 M1]